LLAPAARGPDALAARTPALGPEWLAVGDGATAWSEALERAGARIAADNRVSAVEHCRLALELAPGPPEGVVPEYQRLPDAEISRRAAVRR
ncbi:MAG: hypothetical protein ACRDL8_19490, partial [Solirubrobacteraceae bacterium]